MTNKLLNEEEIMEIVGNYVSEIIHSVFFPANIVKKDDLWKVEGRMFIDAPKSEEISKQISAILKQPELANILHAVDVTKEKLFGMTRVCFYVNSYGKICGFYSAPLNTDVPFAIPSSYREVKENDLKDYCLKAKNLIEKGISSLRYLDFLPLYGWCKSNDESVIFAIVIGHSMFRTFLGAYRINISHDEVDLNMLEEPIEMEK